MGDIGFPELLVILVVALLVFGPGRIPEMGRSLGRALREFRDAIREERPTTPKATRAGTSDPQHPADIAQTNPRP